MTEPSGKRKRRIQPQLLSMQTGDCVGETPSLLPLTSESIPPSPHPLKKQRWTELTAVGQILADQIRQYELQSKLSQGETCQLQTWCNNVRDRIYEQTTLVLENRQLATEMRQKQKEVEMTRDDLMVLRTQTKRFRDEALKLEEEAKESDKEFTERKKASQFLTALQTLAECARRENKRDI